MDSMLLYGPPGTGKTTSGLNWLEEQLARGADPRKAAFVSFTNAAVNVAVNRIESRFGLCRDELPYCRTLHSLCKRACGIQGNDWLADRELDQFAKEYGLDLKATRGGGFDNDDMEYVALKRGKDAPILSIWDFARHRLIFDADAALDAFRRYSPEEAIYISRPRFHHVVAKYEEWKRKNCLRDYTDLLLEYLSNPQALPASVAILDEAQDLSPLMWLCADGLFANTSLRATLGDDDQTLYTYAGANPQLLNRRKAAEKIKLRQSYRLSSAVTGAALAIIEQNRDREPKEIIPVPGSEGVCDRISDIRSAGLLNGESWFILARNWRLLDSITAQLEMYGIPYAMGGGRYSPWGQKGALGAVRAVKALSKGKAITLLELSALASKTSSQRGKSMRAWEWGAKKKLEALTNEKPTSTVTVRDLHDLGMTQWALARVLKGDLAVLTKDVTPREMDAFYAAQKSNTLTVPVNILLSSIHGQKGEEADNVVVLQSCTYGTYRSLHHYWRKEEERRCAYVGVTRARKRVYIMAPEPVKGIHPWEVLRL